MDKLARLKILLGEPLPSDEVLNEYLNISEAEILNWLYIRVGDAPEGASLPARYDQIQIMAVVAAVNIIGAEGETTHIENGMHRVFKYEDLIAYIHSHVQPYVVLS